MTVHSSDHHVFQIRYRRLRTRLWTTLFAFPLFLALVVCAPMLTTPDKAQSLAFAGMIGCAIAWIGHLATLILLMNVICPRCGKRFVLAGLNSWPTKSCKHCGLQTK